MSVENAMSAQQMETPKSTVGAYTLPCGWLDSEGELVTDVEVREMTGNEEDMMASTKIQPHEKVTMLLAGCTTRLGEVTDKGKLTRLMDELTLGDRLYLLFAIRRTTLGDELPVRETCPECGDRSLYVMDLSELKVLPMEDPKKRIFDVELPSGTTARFRVSTGAGEKQAIKYAKKANNDGLSLALMMRLELLNGEPPSLKAVKNLGLKDRLKLRDEFQEVEGGIDTALDLECPACGHEWEEDIDIGNRNFFFPSEKQKR